jgi:hypothetical protein
MIDDQFVLAVERLRDDLKELKAALRARYGSPQAQVRSEDIKSRAAQIAEVWLVRILQNPDVVAAVDGNYLADLNVHFQRLLTFSEAASLRSRYDAEIRAILRDITNGLVIPLKQRRGQQLSVPPGSVPTTTGGEFAPTAFLGHSFAADDDKIVRCVKTCLESIGISVVTGERPRAKGISDKVKKLIEDQYLFVGLFTRRDKLARKKEYTTSTWVIDEKAYALGKGKILVLLREEGVESIGGIHGDYEYIEFSKERPFELQVRLLQLFELTANGIHA